MKTTRLTHLILSLVFMVTMLSGQAHALLKAVGAVDPVSTVPSYYLDTNNLALTLCTDQNGFCILPPPFDPAIPPMSPITATGPVNDANFPDESFYYSAEAIFPIDGDTARLTFVIEAAFLGGVMPDGGIVFLRTDLQKMQGLAGNSTYRVTHPYGTFTFTTDNVGDTTGGGGVAVRQEDTAGGPAQWLPPGMKAGTVTGIGPYLTRKTGGLIVDPVSGHTYIGDAVTPVEVVGSPTGNNFARIERIITNGTSHAPIVVGETNLFTLMGRVFTGPIPSELSTTATYARDAVKGQVDIFATTLPGATVNVSGTGITSADLLQDVPATGKHFLHIPLATSDLPTGLVVTNSLDLQNTPPHALALVDEVNITEANYNQTTNVLTVRAASRDRLPPLPTLTVAGFTAPNTLDTNGVFTKTLTSIPPQTITVTSSKGGSATAPVSVGVPDPVVITSPDTLPAYTIGSLYNQLLTVTGGVPPYTWSGTVSGTLPPGINFFPSTGRLFGTPSTIGTYTFTLQVADSLGTTASKPFTITANTPPNPVAVDDTAATTAGSTVVINVLANDSSPVSSLNPATVAVSAATGGSAVANLDGTVSYTAPANAGTYTFTYTVKDNGATPLVSNAAQVSVTVTVLPPATPTLVGPSGVSSNLSPTYSWNAVSTATDYDLFRDINGTQTIAAFVGSSICTNGVCSVAQAPALADGSNVYWIVRAKNSGGVSAWSTPLTFVATSVSTPATPVLSSPSGIIANTSPVFTWQASAGATEYDVFKDVDGVQTLSTFPASICVSGTCTVTQTPALADGAHVYWIVRAKNSAGISAWSAPLRFTATNAVTPATPSLIAPFGTSGTTPTYSWTDVAGATAYDMFIDINGVQSLATYTSTGNCDGTTCSVTPVTPLQTGSNVYWIIRAKNIAGISSWSTPLTFSAN